MNKIEIIAEKILRIAYENGGAFDGKDMTDEIRSVNKKDLEEILRDFGKFNRTTNSNGIETHCYRMNYKGRKLAHEGFFSGKRKTEKWAMTRDFIAIAIALLSLIISLVKS